MLFVLKIIAYSSLCIVILLKYSADFVKKIEIYKHFKIDTRL